MYVAPVIPFETTGVKVPSSLWSRSLALAVSDPNLIPYLENELDFKLNISNLKSVDFTIPNVKEININSEIKKWLINRYGDSISFEDIERINHSHGHSHEDMYFLRNGFNKIVDDNRFGASFNYTLNYKFPFSFKKNKI